MPTTSPEPCGGSGEAAWFEGNFQAYIEDLKKQNGPDADQPPSRIGGSSVGDRDIA